MRSGMDRQDHGLGLDSLGLKGLKGGQNGNFPK